MSKFQWSCHPPLFGVQDDDPPRCVWCVTKYGILYYMNGHLIVIV